jgi:DNA-binding winged helix-turn-helix (wHTH) protein
LEKKQEQESCIETLVSQGYSIEATTNEYIGYGIGTIS